LLIGLANANTIMMMAAANQTAMATAGRARSGSLLPHGALTLVIRMSWKIESRLAWNG
jgi:hypothetical protein